jgi:membrane protein required for colicin V production
MPICHYLVVLNKFSMLLDVSFAVLMVMAAFKGYSKGLVVAIFSILATIVGLAAATKLSAVTANYLKASLNVGSQWLPVISFGLIFLITVLLVRAGGKLVEKTFKVAMLGTVNTLGGMAMYGCLYTIIYSTVLFYVQKLNIINAETINASVVYPYVASWGPKATESLGTVIPWFTNMFSDLSGFFDGLSKKL